MAQLEKSAPAEPLSTPRKPISSYQRFAPDRAGNFVTNISKTPEGQALVQKYQAEPEKYIVVDLSAETLREQGLDRHGSQGIFSVFNKNK